MHVLAWAMATIGGIPNATLDAIDMEGVARSNAAVGIVGQMQDARAGTRGGGTYGLARARAQAAQKIAPAPPVPWEMLQCRHGEWLGSYWAECRALYAGGRRLLANPELMKVLFPQNLHEDKSVYDQRVKRAHYYPYAGSIIDSLLAGLGSDPLRVTFGETDPKTGELDPAPDSEWWTKFISDVSDEAEDIDESSDDIAGGMPMHHFMVEVLRECMQTRFAWVRCDMPKAPDEDQVTSQLDAEQANAPYLCLVPAEQVIDWEFKSDGKTLAYVITLEKTTPRASILVKRGKVEHHVYTLWTESDWARYEIDIDPAQPPANAFEVPPTDSGAHGFECVPFDRVELPEGLWAMGKLHSLAREHFNKRCAMSWAEYKALFSVLYEFLDDNMSGGGDLPTVDDPNRATTQLRSQGYSQLRRANDKAEFIGPDVSSFVQARESCNDAMREMHRVMFSMALSANMDKAALSRSGDSKEQDSVSTAVVLSALGQLARRIVRTLLSLVARGRGEEVPPAIVQGLEHFDTSGVSQAIADAVAVFTGVPIAKSKTAYTLFLTNLLRKILGDSVTDDQVAAIRQELEEAHDADTEMQQMMQEAALTPPTDPAAGGDDDGENDDEPKPTAPRVGAISSKKPPAK